MQTRLLCKHNTQGQCVAARWQRIVPWPRLVSPCRAPLALKAAQTLEPYASPPHEHSTGDASAPGLVQDMAGARLVAWVRSHGGLVHPSLSVVEKTPVCGCRGVVAVAPISMQDLEQTPLISVPEKLYMTTDHARDLLQKARSITTTTTTSTISHQIGAAGGKRGPWKAMQTMWGHMLAGLGLVAQQEPKPAGEVPQAVIQLGLFLAHERTKGHESFWEPYIAGLPEEPPCAWLLDEERLNLELHALGPHASTWHVPVKAMVGTVKNQVAAAVKEYGSTLGVDESGVTWAVAQVLSRAFGSDQDLGMAPLIDMLNHVEGGDVPGLWEVEGEPHAFITSISPGDPTTPLPLGPGDELFVSYMSSCSPLTAFLNFGFVPPELKARMLSK